MMLSLGVLCAPLLARAADPRAADPKDARGPRPAAPAAAQGVSILARANDAWELGYFRAAGPLYKQALERGGLNPAEVLISLVHLGVASAIVNENEDARSAFLEAAQLNPRFVLPPEAGKAATALAQTAKRELAGTQPLQTSLRVPVTAPPNRPFRVTSDLPQYQLSIVTKLRISAREPSTGLSYEKTIPAADKVTFEIPGEMAPSGRTVNLRIDALDEHDNQLAVSERSIKIDNPPVWIAAPSPLPPPPAPAPVGPGKVSNAHEPQPDPGMPDKAGAAADVDGPEGPAKGVEGDDPWNIPHGSKSYAPVRTEKPPVIDGKLDDEIWAITPKDNRFLSTRSKPYGQPTTEPTTVQLAYDEKNLYVAFRCGYGKEGEEHDDSFAGDEPTLLAESESVTVIVDAVHGHTGGYQFTVSAAGARGDAELSDQGSVQNLDWRGIWDVATARSADGGWTAEFKIPWGTMRMPAHNLDFDLGVNFARREPTSGEYALWTLHPPATELFDVNYFGHLNQLESVHPGQRLFLQPYAALGFDTSPLSNPANPSALTNLTGTDGGFRAYAGAYARYRPPGPVQVDATFNPDFSAVTPDQALANFDRFEIEYPEARPFFAEDTPRFQFGAPRYLFGDLGAQLFYSRRLGIVTDTAGLTNSVPILWGVKSVLRTGGTEAAIMNVETSPAQGPIAFQDNATIARVTQTIEGQRFGAIVLGRAGDSGGYGAAGVDGAVTLYDRHLEISGFVAGSSSATSQNAGLGQYSAAGEGTVSWKSQDVYAKATFIDIGTGFDAPLGYFPLVGVQGELFAAGYTPVIRNDRVQQLFIDTQLSIVHDLATDALVYERGTVGFTIQTIEQAAVQVLVQPAIENVTVAFPVGNGRITVAPGEYRTLSAQLNVTTAPSRPLVLGLGYQGGDLYDGTRRAPQASLGLNFGHLTAKVAYQLMFLHYGSDDFLGHDLQVTASYAYTSLAKTTLVLEADTVAARGTAQLTTSYQFGLLSTITFAVRATSGSTIDTNAVNWTDSPNLSAIISFAYGLSPF